MADLEVGTNEISLTIANEQRKPRSLNVAFGEMAMAKVLGHGKDSTVYLFSTSDQRIELPLSVPTGTSPQLYPDNFKLPIQLSGQASILLEPGECVQIRGLELEELLEANPSAVAVEKWTIAEAKAQ